MEIGINAYDDLDGAIEAPNFDQNQVVTPQEPEPGPEPSEGEEGDFIDDLLRSRGILDKTKIQFENEDGELEDVNWDDLSREEQLNIISSTEEPESDNDLDDSELELIQEIRNSGLSPVEYLSMVQNKGIENYLNNNQTPNYSVDQYSDDELFVMDFISRMGDVTDEEAYEALEQAKSNEELYKKQIGALRKEYQEAEEEDIRQAQFEKNQEAQEQLNQFSEKVIDQINDLTSIQGYDLNLDSEDMQEIYDFIMGQDAAGNNNFSKVLADPKSLVKIAYYTLNGDRMIQDITDYFQKEITRVRKESYNKGLADAKEDNTEFVYKQKSQPHRAKGDDDIDYDFR